MRLDIRPATLADLPALHPLIERAYRGESARAGWTHEADLLSGARTDTATLASIVNDPAQVLLMLAENAVPLGCVNVADRGGGLAYLGMLCVEPARQGGHLGRRLIAAAETHARDIYHARIIEMTVISQRCELIAYYERRGWLLTGERRPFPIPHDPPYVMEVLAKPLV